MPDQSHRRRRRTINQLGADWAEIGAAMIEADRTQTGRGTGSRTTVASKAGLSVAVARKIFRMAGDLEQLRKRNPQFATVLSRFSIAPAEIILRWARQDLRGARKAAAEFQEGRHTIASLLVAERDARAALVPGNNLGAHREIEERVIAQLMDDQRFAGWTIRRIGSEREISESSLPAELLLAGVDAIAEPPSRGMRRRLIMIYQSTLDRPDAQFLRNLKTAVWAAAGVAAHTGMDIWVVVAAAADYPAFNALINLLASETINLTGVQVHLKEFAADHKEAV